MTLTDDHWEAVESERRLNDAARRMNGPLFVTGTYRAGTTWISLLIGNHPTFPRGVGLHTTNWFRESHKHWLQAVEYAEERWGLERQKRLDEPSYPAGDADQWDRAMREMGFGKRWAEKQQLEWTNIPTFLDWFPDGQALHIVRDPRSTLASWARYTHHDWPAALGAAFNCLSSMQAALRYVEKHADREPVEHGVSLQSAFLDRYAMVRYESVAKDPALYVRQMVDWLGLDWPGDDVMLSTQGWQDVPGSRWQDRSSFGRVDEGFDVEKAIHRWRDHLSDEELAFVEHVCWEEMQAFGYEPAHDERPTPDDFPRIAADMEDDPQLGAWWERFRETGEGVEAFPSDPTDESTWAERQEATA